ncbi:hypothetical protein [Nonomuraea sp. CA-141351]|uniref:hypothetical protein n=1 Tax=Nonomuraea sp. CA-141351 TaxID=3239996 RepID=UPI003D8BF5CB
MTVSFATNPSTADLLVFADPSSAVEELSRALDARRMLDEIGQNARLPPGELLDKAARAGGELLQGIDLGSVLLGGWQKYRSLRDAARKTLSDSSDIGQMVPLAEHEIVSRHEPWVEVRINGRPAGKITFCIELIFHVTMLQAFVRRGRLMRLAGGDCTVAVSCKVQGFEVAKPELMRIGLPINRDLGEGIPLLREARAAS